MISVILVDDERIIRLGLRKMIADHCPQITDVYEAGNGVEALELTLKVRPNICIVDMRMPLMGGLEYIARVRALGLDVKIIVLSGYADFSYAQQAMAEGCCGYLLKPVKVDALTQLLNKTLQDILQEREKMELIEQGHRAQQRELEVQFYRAVTLGEADNPSLRKTLNDRHYYSALFSLNAPDMPYWSFSRGQRQRHPLNRASAALCRAGRQLGWEICNLVLDERTVFFLLLPPKDASGPISLPPPWLSGAHKALAGDGIAGSMGVCGPFSGAEQLYQSRLAAAGALERRFYEGAGGLFTTTEDLSDTEPALYNEEHRFLTAMRTNKTAEAKQALDYIFTRLKENRVKKDVCVLVCSHLYLSLLDLLHGQSVHCVPKNAQSARHFREQLELIDTFDDLYAYVETLLLQTASTFWDEGKAAPSLVRNAVRYVEKHAAYPISVNEVADYLGVSVSYLSTLFRKETGERLISFIISYKIDRACEMLEQSNRKIYEISEALGYTDVKYFCKIFRKYVGCTPSEYRESTGGTR